MCIVQGPALYAYNDGVFTDDDWLSVRMLNDSVKKKEPMKVGRFGLGFKSVYHMTGMCDYVCISCTHYSGTFISTTDCFRISLTVLLTACYQTSSWQCLPSPHSALRCTEDISVFMDFLTLATRVTV